MIALLGASGYVGQAFAACLRSRGIAFLAPSSCDLDLRSREATAAWFDAAKPDLVINAVGFTGRPNIDGTEQEKWRCLLLNTVVPGYLAEILSDRGIRWGHVSSGCIFHGARPDGSGFTEEDVPEFARCDPRAGWYARTKWMAEQLLRDLPGVLIWRLRIPFDQFDNERNYISKIMRYDNLLEVRNSISQLQEFAAAALETLLRDVPAGIYNITNPGSVLTSEVAEAIRRHGLSSRTFRYFSGEEAFMATPGRVFRASCVLSPAKLLATGIPLRDVHDSLEWTLSEWKRS